MRLCHVGRRESVQPMGIAYISFEYPSDNAAGGIGRYVHQAAHLMAARGHDVEVFAASDRHNETESIGGGARALVSRVRAVAFLRLSLARVRCLP
jgi:hypothetical protein